MKYFYAILSGMLIAVGAMTIDGGADWGSVLLFFGIVSLVASLDAKD